MRDLRTGDEDGKPIQPPAVVKAVGPRGEHLADSPQKTVFGSATPEPENRLEATTVVAAPVRSLDRLTELQGVAPRTVPQGEVFCAH